MFVLVAYDVVDKRTEKFRSLLCRYLVHEQNSVFLGALKKSQFDMMKAGLKEISIPGDRLMIIISPNRHNVEIERLEVQ
jgi:CRISPR-associated protein Cas2